MKKNIDISFKYLRDLVIGKVIKVVHVDQEANLADMFTMALGLAKFKSLRSKVPGNNHEINNGRISKILLEKNRFP